MNKVLLCDDDTDFAKMIVLVLKGLAETIQANTGQEVLEKCNSDSFCCIIIDIHLSDMNGIEVARKIRENKNIPIIIISGSAKENIGDSFLDESNVIFLEKPFEMSTLKDTVKKFVS